MSFRNLSLTAGLALFFAWCAAGCDALSFKGGGLTQAVPAGQWPFTPASMRIHPFTEVTQEPAEDDDDSDYVLEARIELLDQVGDVTKGVGDWRFELYGDEADEASRRRLEVWQVEMTNLEQNERHYDPITRTYAFKLRLGSPPPRDEPLTLTAQLTNPQGERLLTESQVTHEEPGDDE